jgi:ribosomal protein L10
MRNRFGNVAFTSAGVADQKRIGGRLHKLYADQLKNLLSGETGIITLQRQMKVNGIAFSFYETNRHDDFAFVFRPLKKWRCQHQIFGGEARPPIRS